MKSSQKNLLANEEIFLKPAFMLHQLLSICVLQVVQKQTAAHFLNK